MGCEVQSAGWTPVQWKIKKTTGLENKQINAKLESVT